MKQITDYYVLFKTHTDAMALYQAARRRGLSVKISPTPRQASVCCGVSLLVEADTLPVRENSSKSWPIVWAVLLTVSLPWPGKERPLPSVPCAPSLPSPKLRATSAREQYGRILQQKLQHTVQSFPNGRYAGAYGAALLAKNLVPAGRRDLNR